MRVIYLFTIIPSTVQAGVLSSLITRHVRDGESHRVDRNSDGRGPEFTSCSCARFMLLSIPDGLGRRRLPVTPAGDAAGDVGC